MSENAKSKLYIGLVLIFILLLGFGWCWKIRDTPESRRIARKEAAKTLRQSKTADILPFLEKISSERSFHVRFDGGFKMGFDTCVPGDFIAQLTEEAILRFAGNGTDVTVDVPHMKEVLAFSEKMIPACTTEAAANALRDRRLDGLFLIKDYDGAIALLEKGLPGHKPDWCKGTAAKLRAHKAMDAQDWSGAVKHLLDFGSFMLSDSQKDFEDCDPTTGVIYSRDWVVARNFMRCSEFSKKSGKDADAAKYANEAKKYFKTALDKAKDDKKSLETLQQEMKSYGL